MDDDAYRAGASGRPLQGGFDSNDYHAGANHRRNMEAISARNERSVWSSSSGGAGPSGTLTLKGCFAGLAFFTALPVVAYVVIGIAVNAYDHRTKNETRVVNDRKPACTQPSPPCDPNEIYADEVTGTLHPHPPKDQAELEAWRRQTLERQEQAAAATKRAAKEVPAKPAERSKRSARPAVGGH